MSDFYLVFNSKIIYKGDGKDIAKRFDSGS
jgi:hypothetical protein